MKDLMLDLESLSTNYDGLVIQIGGAYFDRETGEIGRTFCQNIDISKGIKYDLKLKPETVHWWLAQSKEAQESILKDPKPIEEVLENFAEFAKDAKYVWSHATFDFVMLKNTYRIVGIKYPFSYSRAARDIRTLVDLAKVSVRKIEREGLHHNALDDCKYQVKYCVAAFNSLKGRKKC